MKGMDFPCFGTKGLITLEYKIPKPKCLQSPASLGVHWGESKQNLNSSDQL